jgi:hypothetical protein
MKNFSLFSFIKKVLPKVYGKTIEELYMSLFGIEQLNLLIIKQGKRK